MKKILIALFLGLCAVAHAQTVDNILDITAAQTHGTARFTALGGSFTALGNDISGLHYNPAGIGVFRRDNFNLTLGIANAYSNATYGSDANNASAGTLLFESLGYVKKFKTRGKSTFGLGISYVKKADFYQNLSVFNTSSPGASLAESWFQRAEGKTPQALINEGLLEEFAAFQTFILDTVNSNVVDGASFPANASPSQDYEIIKTGGNNEFAITFGGSYASYLNWGISLNIPNTRTFTTQTFTENRFPPSTNGLANHTTTRIEDFSATGFNANFGVILKPAQWIRVAASYQTPTAYRFYNNYEVTVVSAFADGFSTDHTVVSEADGSLYTPGVIRTGLAFVISKYGLLSLGYETSNSGNSTITGNEFRASQLAIEDFLQRTNTYRAGLEIKLNNYFLRGGFAQTTDPLTDPLVDMNTQYSTSQMFSGGFGYRTKHYTLDLTVTNTNIDRNIPTYFGDANTLTETLSKTNIVLGLNVMF